MTETVFSLIFFGGGGSGEEMLKEKPRLALKISG